MTMGGVAISRTLYIQSGSLSFGSTTTSTAMGLTFDNTSYQAMGTWVIQARAQLIPMPHASRALTSTGEWPSGSNQFHSVPVES